LFTGNEPAALLKTVNRQAYTSSLADRFATVFYGVLDEATRTLRYVNAGHNPPFILRRNGSVEWLELGGPPVGMFPDSSYEQSVVKLDSGDLVIAYSDGVIEATNQCGDEWGVEGLLKAIAPLIARRDERAEDLVRLLFNSMDDFSGGLQTDDATLVILNVP
jgi:sigma-B regulation protein RsbU (phosphoserine phosphatase)